MKPRTWKFVVVLMALLTAASFEYMQGFHSAEVQGTTYNIHNSPDRGTLIIIEALPNVNVKVNATFNFAGNQRGVSTIHLLNGTVYTLNNSNQYAYVVSTFNGQWFYGESSGNYGFQINLSSGSKPVGIAVVYNYSIANFNAQYLSSQAFGTNYFAVYVNNSALFQVNAVAMPI